MTFTSLRWPSVAVAILISVALAGCSSDGSSDVEALEARIAELESDVASAQPSTTRPLTTQPTTTVPVPSDAGIDMMDAYCVGMFDGYAIAADDPADPSRLRTVLDTCLEFDPLPGSSVLEVHCYGIGMGATLRTGDADAGRVLSEGCAVVVTQDFDYVEVLAQRTDILADNADLFLELFTPQEE